MDKATASASPAADRGEGAGDGRRERSRSSRAKIVEAMLTLVEHGDVAPSAARVADTAGVGLRTVFRHFDDMDSLYREMSSVIEQRVMPLVSPPLRASGWRDRIIELTARRAIVFEHILPFRISANLKRFQSAFLMQDYQRMLMLERSTFTVLLPPEVLADSGAVEALNVILGFQTWRVLRHDQALPADAAATVVRRLVDAMLETLPEA